jgi:hypothetical protein
MGNQISYISFAQNAVKPCFEALAIAGRLFTLLNVRDPTDETVNSIEIAVNDLVSKVMLSFDEAVYSNRVYFHMLLHVPELAKYVDGSFRMGSFFQTL